MSSLFANVSICVVVLVFFRNHYNIEIEKYFRKFTTISKRTLTSIW